MHDAAHIAATVATAERVSIEPGAAPDRAVVAVVDVSVHRDRPGKVRARLGHAGNTVQPCRVSRLAIACENNAKHVRINLSFLL